MSTSRTSTASNTVARPRVEQRCGLAELGLFGHPECFLSDRGPPDRQDGADEFFSPDEVG